MEKRGEKCGESPFQRVKKYKTLLAVKSSLYLKESAPELEVKGSTPFSRTTFRKKSSLE